MVDLAIALNRFFEFTCPRCGSHNVNIAWDNHNNGFVVTCATCGHKRRYVRPKLMNCLHDWWNIRVKTFVKHDDQPKEAVKQCVVRSNTLCSPEFSKLHNALEDGWTVVMCNKMCDGTLEYILEKKVKE